VISRTGKLQTLLWIGILSATCFGQKVKVGHDKTVDFSKYKSYTFHVPEATGRPFLYMTVVSSIKTEVEAKGLTSVENDGDLTLTANGGFDYGSNSDMGLTPDSCTNCKAPLVDPMDWTGKMGPPGSSGTGHPKGVLELIFVDRASNKVVWAGTVEQKLDPEKKQKSLEKAQAAIKKLLVEFPPKS
jgi:hypothetical protein